MKRFFKFLPLAFLPLTAPAFDIFEPIKVPNMNEYVIYNKASTQPKLPDASEARIDTSLLVYNIQNQAANGTSMYYIKNNQIHYYDAKAWAAPVGKMLTVSLFEYLLDENIVTKLAYQDLNIRQDFTLSGTTPYGPIADLDHNVFYIYITFYLANERTNDTQIKTFKFEKKNIDSLSAEEFVELSNQGVESIFHQLKPWLETTLKEEKNKKTPESLLPKLKVTGN